MEKESCKKAKVLLAKIVSTKGLKGEVKLKTFTEDSLSILNYDIFDDRGTVYNIQSAYVHKNLVVAKFLEVESIEEAEAMVGISLFTLRESMPRLDDDNFYHVDLIGLKALDVKENFLGVVLAIYNYGAGDMLEIQRSDKTTFLVPFSKHHIPEVKMSEGIVIIVESSYSDQESFEIKQEID